ncbi:hypothetical protein BDN71DRAFT_1448177 [Pleurotus eryngii]|uniref:Uncharacterized protein n=1 Tax=Pleurotus eryngii TaxID=5323 RepID=A0A9P5ZWQ0_PLEER|nr:hypothetical protein BDN71DRAFT_1448177 [Pleurotus eryngii]
MLRLAVAVSGGGICFWNHSVAAKGPASWAKHGWRWDGNEEASNPETSSCSSADLVSSRCNQVVTPREETRALSWRRSSCSKV